MLKRRVQAAGLLDRSLAGALPRILVLSAMFALGVAGLIWLAASWWQLATAGYFAILFAQIGFLGHDAGHQQIFRSRPWNDRLGLLLSNAGIGLSYGWWVDKHNRHHRHPNDVGRDPDVQRNVLSWTDGQAAEQRGLLRVVARHQALFFFPLLLLEGLNLHAGSARGLRDLTRHRSLEVALLLAHLLGGAALLLVVMPPLHALAFLAIQQALFGVYLGMSFAPNHKGMQLMDGETADDFLRRQVLPSRNVLGGRLMSIACGGLNYQIEHHLFPSMPSRNLRRARPLVRRFCANREVPYCEVNLFASYRRVLSYLRSVQP